MVQETIYNNENNDDDDDEQKVKLRSATY